MYWASVMTAPIDEFFSLIIKASFLIGLIVFNKKNIILLLGSKVRMPLKSVSILEILISNSILRNINVVLKKN